MGNILTIVLLILSGDLRNTNSLPLTCYSNENCEANHLCNKTCSVDQYCFAIWTNNSGNVKVLMHGCWSGRDAANCETATCKLGIRIEKQNYFCCCNKDFCNDELGLDPEVYVAPNLTSTREASKLQFELFVI